MKKIAPYLLLLILTVLLLPNIAHADDLGILIWIFIGPVILAFWLVSLIMMIVFIKKLHDYKKLISTMPKKDSAKLSKYKKSGKIYIIICIIFIIIFNLSVILPGISTKAFDYVGNIIILSILELPLLILALITILKSYHLIKKTQEKKL